LDEVVVSKLAPIEASGLIPKEALAFRLRTLIAIHCPCDVLVTLDVLGKGMELPE